MERDKNTCDELVEVVQTLRSEHGCPWDRAQTFQSLRPCMLEEAYEYLAAVRIYEQTGNAENLCEELGDLLLQVVMNSEIAKELGLFDLSDVAAKISEKMIRRHPHIFAGQSTDHDDGSQKSWDEIKKQEKEGKPWIESPLREIPKEHPALIRAPKVLKKADKLYEACPDETQTLENLESRIQKLREMSALQGNSVKEAEQSEEQRSRLMGELLMDICNLGRIWKLPLEQILQDRVEEMIERNEPLPE